MTVESQRAKELIEAVYGLSDNRLLPHTISRSIGNYFKRVAMPNFQGAVDIVELLMGKGPLDSHELFVLTHLRPSQALDKSFLSPTRLGIVHIDYTHYSPDGTRFIYFVPDKEKGRKYVACARELIGVLNES